MAPTRSHAEADRHAELESRCAFLDAALESITDFVYALDRNRRFVYANKAAYNVYGDSESALVGKRICELDLGIELETMLEAWVDRIFATGEQMRDEIDHVARDGRRGIHQLVWGPMLDTSGAVELVVCVSRVDTERRNLEERLAGHEARLRAVTELSPTLLWETDVKGAAFTANPQWLAYVGNAAAVRNFAWIDAIHPAERDAAEAAFRTAFRNGTSLDQRHRMRRADGTYRWFTLRHVPIVDDRGTVVRWLGAATDVQDQHLALDEVERRVLSRTRERDSLRRRLLASDEAQRRSLARELHDRLGQQMTGLSMGLDRVQHLTNRENHPDAAALHQRVDELRGLTMEMMKAVRYVTLELRAPELDDMGVQSAIATYVREWGERYGVRTHFDGPQPEVVGSAEAASTLYRIVQEALTNVIKHAKASRIDITLKRAERDLILSIQDDGDGFDVEAVRARSKVTRRLGLAGIQERVFLSGGTFTIQSHPGDGSGLQITIPDREPETDE